jgi:uncharacterized membrane protein
MPLTYQPFADNPEIENIAHSAPSGEMEHSHSQNVGRTERNWSVIGGAALAALSLTGRGIGRILGMIAGAALVHRGVTGRCQVYQSLGINTSGVDDQAGVRDNEGHKVVRSIVVARPKEELFAYWRKLENLASVMSYVESVQELDSRTSHWVVKGPAGVSFEWDAEIINERPNELIAWQSLPGSQVPNAGSVWFEDAEGGTRIKVALEVEAPAGELGIMVADLFGQSPEKELERDLQRFKEQMEGIQSPN